MKQLSIPEKEKILSKIFWDIDIDMDKLISKINEMSVEPTDLETIIFYRRLLTSCSWYTLLKLVPIDRIQKMLSDAVIQGIYPKELKNKLLYARTNISK
jgi:hypothetical protein